jgi:hypothetical protein
MLRLEKALDECVSRLESQLERHDGDWSNQDDIDSIASGSAMASSFARVRIVGRPPSGFGVRGSIEADRTRRQLVRLEEENRKLREEVLELKKQSSRQSAGPTNGSNDNANENVGPTTADGSEGAAWNVVLRNGH